MYNILRKFKKMGLERRIELFGSIMENNDSEMFEREQAAGKYKELQETYILTYGRDYNWKMAGLN
jgi:hypothetical protein